MDEEEVVGDARIPVHVHLREGNRLDPHQPRRVGGREHHAGLLVQLAGERLHQALVGFDSAAGTDPHRAAVRDAVLGQQDSVLVDEQAPG